MFGFLVFLLIAWLVLSVLGFVIKGLLWLAFLGIVLFVVTAIILWLKRMPSRLAEPLSDCALALLSGAHPSAL